MGDEYLLLLQFLGSTSQSIIRFLYFSSNHARADDLRVLGPTESPFLGMEEFFLTKPAVYYDVMHTEGGSRQRMSVMT